MILRLASRHLGSITARNRPALRATQRLNMSTTNDDAAEVKFGPFPVTKQVFLKTQHSFGVVNLKPILPGHVLVCPLQPHRRLTDLSAAETSDLFATVQRVQRMLSRVHFKTDRPEDGGSFTVAVQDGPESGQTVPHVHVHVIPRIAGDMGEGEASDEIYVKMASEEANVGGALWDVVRRPEPGGGMPRVEDACREARKPDDMHAEADMYKRALERM
ncbi:Bifunctional bis(5'-adenosyl)-triphosphatase/adenylylsulfatase FHIT [Beauveria bassiana]|nr:Bifunctional bis(5'-adenosyl)-triphosphatase/adenylylsulfatase FHIT [Beauveria bassiana]